MTMKEIMSETLQTASRLSCLVLQDEYRPPAKVFIEIDTDEDFAITMDGITIDSFGQWHFYSLSDAVDALRSAKIVSLYKNKSGYFFYDFLEKAAQFIIYEDDSDWCYGGNQTIELYVDRSI